MRQALQPKTSSRMHSAECPLRPHHLIPFQTTHIAVRGHGILAKASSLIDGWQLHSARRFFVPGVQA